MTAAAAPAVPTAATAPTARWQTWLALAGGLLVFGGYNHAILRNESLLARGDVVRLELAPVDPRAFLTGDYMRLDYALAREAARRHDAAASGRRTPDAAAAAGRDAFAIVAVDADRVARLVRLQPAATPRAAGEHALLVRFRAGRARIGTDAWYFEEGTGKRLEAARYGEFRVGADGRTLLTGLLDAGRQPLP
ncbi:MAG: GDYXXLXY domain-containing protein [Lautropia sp.]